MTDSTPFLALAVRGHISFLKSTFFHGTDNVLNQIRMKLHGKLGSFLRIKTKVLKKVHAVRDVNGGFGFKVKAVSAERGQLCRLKAYIEIRTSNQRVARVDS